MGPLELGGLAAGLLGAVLFGVGAVAQAHGVRRHPTPPVHLGAFVARSVRDPWTWLVLSAYLGGFVLHAAAIWLLPLYLTQATVAMALPVAALAQRHVEEPLGRAHWGSVGLVVLGLVLLAAGSGSAGAARAEPVLASSLVAGAALLGLASALRHHVGAAGLGTLAGLGYAGSAVAVRGVELPLGAWAVVCALAVPSFSLVAFWLYSLGMDRASVSWATAPMNVGQTFVPAAVGVALLGDTVRPGWWWVVLLGLVLSTWGAVRLGRAADLARPHRPTGAGSAELAPSR
ncbi:drug/metabolite transporter (DMT)-like permease [Nocardioides marinisabuli]|uniref:Drug/metabolite transporter (DMT)-like permease n=1 Tax=Nocardioides marinisabuli TaxID=419476 RepID=A0A7Y9JT38_9ACTN|nr:hypothetical protein [Nocardioides marinisabuli]NYD58419.1 drug/metabolite transporter (DMT)-like permease [Nocardioides marinisabuli]